MMVKMRCVSCSHYCAIKAVNNTCVVTLPPGDQPIALSPKESMLYECSASIMELTYKKYLPSAPVDIAGNNNYNNNKE